MPHTRLILALFVEGQCLIYQKSQWGTNISRLLEYQFPLRFQFPWKFLHNLRGTLYVQVKIFPAPIHKKAFFIYDPVTICSFAQKLAPNKYIFTILEYQFPLRYQLSFGFLQIFRNTAEVKLFNFQDPIQSSDFGSSCIKTQCLTLPEKVVRNHSMCQ